jgi:hypothetical protein
MVVRIGAADDVLRQAMALLVMRKGLEGEEVITPPKSKITAEIMCFPFCCFVVVRGRARLTLRRHTRA